MIKLGNIDKRRIRHHKFINLIDRMLCINQFSRPDINTIINLIPDRPKSNNLNKTSNKLLPALYVPNNLNQWDNILPKPSYQQKMIPNSSLPEIKPLDNKNNDIYRSKSELGYNKGVDHQFKNNNYFNQKKNNYFMPKIVNHNDKVINNYYRKNPRNIKKNYHQLDPINPYENYKKKKSKLKKNRRGSNQYGKDYISPYNQYQLRKEVNFLYNNINYVNNKNIYISEYKAEYRNNLLPKI
jgi:hypothetical protein